MPGMLDPYFYGRMRANMPVTDPMHRVVAPLEHREFVRDAVKVGHPLMPLAMVPAIPAYTVGKKVGEFAQRNPLNVGLLPGGLPLVMLLHKLGLYPQQNTSPASLDEVFAGYEGLFSGLRDRYQPQKANNER